MRRAGGAVQVIAAVQALARRSARRRVLSESHAAQGVVDQPRKSQNQLLNKACAMAFRAWCSNRGESIFVETSDIGRLFSVRDARVGTKEPFKIRDPDDCLR